MAKWETSQDGYFDEILRKIETGIMQGSMTASLEAASDFRSGNARCSVRVFERYSVVGTNRLSLSVTLFQGETGPVRMCAVSAGGSEGMFLKINTWGEEAFLDKLRDILLD